MQACIVVATGVVKILYTGPVTASVTLKACGGCKTYSNESVASSAARKAGGPSEPKTTIRLPVGNYHFLYRRDEASNDYVAGHNAGLKGEPNYTNTDCLYIVGDLLNPDSGEDTTT
ncbi:hypothetical protein ACFUNF_21725 [Streptomyces sp. NPDC057291]|uniref:hypothetical protein n=1 Tax=Streptomyces sp. NPDC057291 TaxID=3346087 RepID=UPI00362E8CD3